MANRRVACHSTSGLDDENQSDKVIEMKKKEEEKKETRLAFGFSTCPFFWFTIVIQCLSPNPLRASPLCCKSKTLRVGGLSISRPPDPKEGGNAGSETKQSVRFNTSARIQRIIGKRLVNHFPPTSGSRDAFRDRPNKRLRVGLLLAARRHEETSARAVML